MATSVFTGVLTLMGLSLAVQLIAILMLHKFLPIEPPTGRFAENYSLFHKVGMKLVLMLLGLSSAALGTSMTGENGSTSTVFDTTNQRIAVGGTGLTVAKLRQARRILMANEVDVSADPLYIAVTGLIYVLILRHL